MGCCGARFRAWARGPSKVVEIQADNGDWYALLADRPPQELDDEIKRVHHQWHLACSRLTAQDIMKAIPMAYPKTGQTIVPGVSKFDFAEWREHGSPTLTHSGWIALCHLIASKEPLNFERIISVCAQLRANL